MRALVVRSAVLLALAPGCRARAPVDAASPAPTPPASVAVSASARVAPRAPRLSCQLALLSAVGYDEPRDELTLCDDAGCVTLPPTPAQPRLGARPSVALAPPAPVLRAAPRPEDALTLAPTRVAAAANAKLYAPLPPAPSVFTQALFLSAASTRAVVMRVPSMAMPAHVRLDLLDLEAHRALATATLCDYPIEAWATVDDAERVVALHFGHDNPLELVGLVDLARGRFATLGDVHSVGYECTPADDFGTRFARAEDVVLFDAERRVVGRTLVSLGGDVVARLEGDDPSWFVARVPAPWDARAEVEQRVLDAGRRVIVRAEAGRVCAGVASVAPPGAPVSAAREPRCAPCEAARSAAGR